MQYNNEKPVIIKSKLLNIIQLLKDGNTTIDLLCLAYNLDREQASIVIKTLLSL